MRSVSLDLSALIAAAAVGALVGLAGSGGGALLTPILVLAMGVSAKSAVTSDLVAGLCMRPLATVLRARAHVVRWRIVALLGAGSLPAALIGGFAAAACSPSASHAVIQPAIGAALLASGAIGLGRWRAPTERAPRWRPRRRLAATVLLGVLGGLAVGATSVGAGSLMLTGLGVLYPELSPAELVGTDLAQAVPLVAAATAGHVLSGGVTFGLSASVAIGGALGAAAGSLAARRVAERALGVILPGVLWASGAAMVGWPALVATGALAGAAAWRRARRRAASPAQGAAVREVAAPTS